LAHRNPWKARAAQWRKRWPVEIQELQADAYAVLRIAWEGTTVEDDEQRRKNILCYFQGLTSLAKLLEASELVALQERIAALEARLQEQGSTNGHHAPYAR
jgi:hypothetical protein